MGPAEHADIYRHVLARSLGEKAQVTDLPAREPRDEGEDAFANQAAEGASKTTRCAA